MTWQGGKQSRDEAATPPTAQFACLQPLLAPHEQDLTGSFDKLAQALGNFTDPVRCEIRLVGTERTEASWDVQSGGSASPAARMQKAKNPDVIVVVRPETWMQIAQGQLAPFEAMYTGRLRVGGDLELAKRIAQHLSDPAVPFVPPC